MPRIKKAEAVSQETVEKREETVEVAPVKGAKVYDTAGNFVREYTKAVHGADYEALAKQFAGKKGYIVK